MSEKFEIYQMAVEMADRVSARRMAANGFFLSAHTALVTILGFTYEKVSADHKSLLIIVGLTGFLLAWTWFFAIRSYRRLNRAKFNVINKMEKDLSAQYFTDEWAELTRTTEKDLELKSLRDRWLKFKDRYTTLTNVESIVPIVFVIIYIVIVLGAIFGIVV
ncbi:MAG TPA: hypothetical protein VHX87_06985 [Galbitalea sp.]|jgi:hypothetical protein|nr:hypothetical protein [Galbitalea sp.]